LINCSKGKTESVRWKRQQKMKAILDCKRTLIVSRANMGVRTNFSREGNVDNAYPFQIADDAVQMDVHKTLYSFNTAKKMPPVLRQQSQKMRFVGSSS